MAMTLRADKGAILSWNEMDANFNACMGVHNLLHVQDQKSAGVGSGTFTSGAWRTRVLNTVIINNISGATLAYNQITLDYGEYYFEAIPLAAYVGTHQARLFNVSDSNVLLVGMSIGSSSSVAIDTISFLSGKFALTSQKVLELQHYCNTTRANYGFGDASTSSLPFGVFCDVKIWKLS